jgi:hypothetical protein
MQAIKESTPRRKKAPKSKPLMFFGLSVLHFPCLLARGKSLAR